MSSVFILRFTWYYNPPCHYLFNTEHFVYQDDDYEPCAIFGDKYTHMFDEVGYEDDLPWGSFQFGHSKHHQRNTYHG
jgi:hypothetical protein